jgi:hypothetical protein
MVSPNGYLSNLYQSRAQRAEPPGPSICRALGLEKAVLRDVAMRAESARPIDLDEIRVILPEEIKRAGSVSAWCRQVGLDRSNLSQVLHKRRRLGGKILAALKLSNFLLDADLANAGAIIRRGTKTALTKRKLLAPPQY